MNEIRLNTDTDQPRVDSRLVAEGFGIAHKSLCVGLQKHFSDLKSLNITDSGTGRPARAYLLSERQIAILPAIVKPTMEVLWFQETLVDLFLEMRMRLNRPKQLTETEKNVLLAKQVLEDQKLISKQAERIEEMAPKELFHDTVTASNDLMPLSHFGKIAGFGKDKIFDILYDDGFLYWDNKRRIPHLFCEKQGLLKYKSDTFEIRKGKCKGETRATGKVFITPKGQAFFINKYKSSGQLRLEGKQL